MYNFKLYIPCNRASKQIKQELPKAQVDVHITGRNTVEAAFPERRPRRVSSHGLAGHAQGAVMLAWSRDPRGLMRTCLRLTPHRAWKAGRAA